MSHRVILQNNWFSLSFVVYSASTLTWLLIMLAWWHIMCEWGNHMIHIKHEILLRIHTYTCRLAKHIWTIAISILLNI